jgi:hypothetical protein
MSENAVTGDTEPSRPRRSSFRNFISHKLVGLRDELQRRLKDAKTDLPAGRDSHQSVESSDDKEEARIALMQCRNRRLFIEAWSGKWSGSPSEGFRSARTSGSQVDPKAATATRCSTC